MTSEAYVIEVSPAPGISCETGSLQAHAISWSTMTSWAFGPAATRKCFSIMRQYSSAQSWRTLQTRKTEASSCCAGCGSKKLWHWEPNVGVRPWEGGGGNRRTLELHAAGFECGGHVLFPILWESCSQAHVLLKDGGE
jgi:hypothetical protein